MLNTVHAESCQGHLGYVITIKQYKVLQRLSVFLTKCSQPLISFRGDDQFLPRTPVCSILVYVSVTRLSDQPAYVLLNLLWVKIVENMQVKGHFYTCCVCGGEVVL